MSLYTAIVEHSECKHCGGIGSISEYVPCDDCDGCGWNVEHDVDCDNEECVAGEIEANSISCKFCSTGDVITFTLQFECHDEDTCVALIKGSLAKNQGFVETNEYCDILECPTPLKHGRVNVWAVTLADDNQWFDIVIVKTERNK